MHAGGRTALPANPHIEQPPNGMPLGKPGGNYIVETEHLNSGRIGFVLGRRGRSYEYNNMNVGELIGNEAAETAAAVVNPQVQAVINSRKASRVHDFQIGGVDMNSMYRLCSFEYLQSYFFFALRTTEVDLDAPVNVPDGVNGQIIRKKHLGAGAYARPGPNGDKINQVDGQRLIRTLTGDANLQGGQDVQGAVNSGVFAGDDGPFLRGKTLDSRRIAKRTVDARPNVSRGYVSADVGDTLAFDVLEAHLKAKGLMDWVPDGIVHSKLDNGEGSDVYASDYLDDRDGQLFNVTIAGSAITTTWSGDPDLVVMPLDKLFIVIVADVFHNGTDPDAVAAIAALAAIDGTQGRTVADYERAFKTAIGNDSRAPTAGLAGVRADTRTGAAGQKMTNFHLRRMTSSQIINYSAYVKGSERSRLGMPIGDNGGRYIVGGWCIGTVTDSAAASAVEHGASLMGSVKRSRTSNAMGLLVRIEWWSGDRMYRAFADRASVGAAGAETRGVTRSRYDAMPRSPDELALPLRLRP
jgi:hypothetical protein